MCRWVISWDKWMEKTQAGEVRDHSSSHFLTHLNSSIIMKGLRVRLTPVIHANQNLCYNEEVIDRGYTRSKTKGVYCRWKNEERSCRKKGQRLLLSERWCAAAHELKCTVAKPSVISVMHPMCTSLSTTVPQNIPAACSLVWAVSSNSTATGSFLIKCNIVESDVITAATLVFSWF